MKLVVGLGNPGSEYAHTRHNIGFKVIDKLLDVLHLDLEKTQFNGTYVKHDDFIIAKPLTYMNLSGNFVKEIMNFYKINVEDILVIHDEIAFDLGVVKLKQNGSSNGQNGVNSIITQLGTQDFKRVRVGIKNQYLKSISSFVLSKFSHKESDTLKAAIASASVIAYDFIKSDKSFSQLMNEYNR
ncbi:aminoacyl-tRNA hydrolase [Mycoplasma bradburyae]|uniref:Peptidyl-tRNA hydrolase n=1 Tax=Mycoplasma bradburyae TaxID=2963128 RepID=A0AAW6HN71_9MOLU|nr:aminoacyl-tRNA hydrolase [Mycoplasma bradburyae]MDC4163166.1 aminoacyl-tRNA hydrolase [Mycoplasma bradburyae]MDC4181780.1 aminoacyl-tRNA hydrolase [Mycoplasma bradburyae]MDC4182481.1 aminoacyl-tRNA hydrolase [Mycoplasma bradburyae]MDC4183154.1 aminoacyl-tRNA hydrolase [Mycoplasma bradburyae]MDC4183963.1 aminoacyl-tRNA hydrolase [Mycoplasma bradburyae]